MMLKKIITEKITFDSDNDLPLNKPLKFLAMTIIIRSLFKEGGKLYPEVFLYELYEIYTAIRNN